MLLATERWKQIEQVGDEHKRLALVLHLLMTPRRFEAITTRNLPILLRNYEI